VLQSVSLKDIKLLKAVGSLTMVLLAISLCVPMLRYLALSIRKFTENSCYWLLMAVANGTVERACVLIPTSDMHMCAVSV